MPDGNNMNIENQPINKRSTRRQFGKLLLASLGVAAAYKPLKWLEERDKQLQPKTTTAATATPNPDSIIPNIPTPEATSQAQRPLPLKEVESLRQQALLNGQERIPLPEGFGHFQDFRIKNPVLGQNIPVIVGTEPKQTGWINLPALADGDFVALTPPSNLEYTKIYGIKTPEGKMYTIFVPTTSEMIPENKIKMGEKTLSVLYNPASKIHQGFVDELDLPQDTSIAIARIDANSFVPEPIDVKSSTLFKSNGDPVTISISAHLPFPKSQQA